MIIELQAVVRDYAARDGGLYSQGDEDAVLDAIVGYLQIDRGTFVEIGVGSGEECNTRRLASHGWRGLWIDQSPIPYVPHNVRTVLAEVTQANVVELLTCLIQPPVDVFSLDIDGNDYWVGLPAIDFLQPTIICVEYNAGKSGGYVMPYAPGYRWRPGMPFGAALDAWREALEPTYACVYQNAVNVFFVRRAAVLDSRPCAEARSR